jgi:hypothetical protein
MSGPHEILAVFCRTAIYALAAVGALWLAGVIH